MNYLLQDPPMPSLRKWIKLHLKYGHQSIIRLLEYDNLMRKNLQGRGLDFGGGENSRYKAYLNQIDVTSIDSINIDPAMKPTYLINPGGMGIEDVPKDAYDFAISLNTFEHVEDPRLAFAALYESLKKDSSCYISVPFMFRIHAHPDDYLRCTPSWWASSLSRAGFNKIVIWPLVLGRATTAGSLVGFPKLFGPYLGRHLAFAWDYLYHHLAEFGKYSERRKYSITSISIGWFIEASK